MIRIVTDSTASLPKDMANSHDIQVASLYLNYKGREYEDASMDVDAFYEDIYDMVDDIPTSSQPSKGTFEKIFDNIAQAGDELLGIFMSSRMSGTLDNALAAARSVAERYSSFKFKIIDTTSNSFDEAWSVIEAACARSRGCTLEQCCEIAVNAIKSTRFLFTPESLRFLKAGGRIGNASALLGTIMKIRPIITVSDGESSTFAKVRTQKKALDVIVDKFKEDISEHGLRNAMVHYIGSSEAARKWAREVISPICGKDVQVVPVSPVIGLHVGPAVGIAYECEDHIEGKLGSSYPSIVFSS